MKEKPITQYITRNDIQLLEKKSLAQHVYKTLQNRELICRGYIMSDR